MARTYFQDFNRDDGSPITVEYGVEGSYSPTTYSPLNGACGGDAPEFSIIASWPATPEYNALQARRMELDTTIWGKPTHPAFITPEVREELIELDAKIATLDAAAVLSDAERERMEAWIAEHYVDEPDDMEF
jgi:hypothetical protein